MLLRTIIRYIFLNFATKYIKLLKEKKKKYSNSKG